MSWVATESRSPGDLGLGGTSVHQEEVRVNIDIDPEDIKSFTEFIRGEFKCKLSSKDIFGVEFEDQDNVQIKIKVSDESDVKLSCNECNKSFDSKRGYTQHMFKVHRDKDICHRCQLCDYSTKYKKKLDTHIEKKHNNDGDCEEDTQPLCVECGKQFQNGRNLKRHQEEVHYGPEFNCDQCDYKSRRKRDLQKHVMYTHNTDPTVKRPQWYKYKQSDERFTCPQCGQSFRKKSYVKEHIERVHEQVKYICDQCDKVYSRRSHLRRHIEADHENKRLGKVFKCEDCDYETARQEYLNRHRQAVHLGGGFTCHLCGYKTTFQSTLNVHIESVHEGKKYQCDVCFKEYANQGVLWRHKKTVHEGHKYNCNLCGAQFTQGSTLTTHMKKKHLIENFKNVKGRGSYKMHNNHTSGLNTNTNTDPTETKQEVPMLPPHPEDSLRFHYGLDALSRIHSLREEKYNPV